MKEDERDKYPDIKNTPPNERIAQTK